MPRKRGSKVATPSVKWSALEITAMLAAWRDALEAPAYRGFTVRTHMFDQFVERCGGATPRALASVCFKRETLRNMADLIYEYHESVVEGQKGDDEEAKQDAPSSSTSAATTASASASRELDWFSLSVSERKDWFEEHNMRSYTFLDIGVDTFREVKELQEMAQRYEYTKFSKSGGPRVKKEQNEGERQAVRERKRAAMSSQAAVDLAAALIARPVESAPSPPNAYAETTTSTSGNERCSNVELKTPEIETVASIAAPTPASVINNAGKYGSETQEKESLLDIHHNHHHHHHDAGYDGSSTESDSDAGVWDEDQDQDLESDDAEEDNQTEAANDAVSSSEGVITIHGKDDSAANEVTSQNNNATEAPITARSSEEIQKLHKDSVAAAAIPDQTNRVDQTALREEEPSVRSRVEVPAKLSIEASSTAVVSDTQAQGQDQTRAQQRNQKDGKEMQAVDTSTRTQKEMAAKSLIKLPSLSQIAPVASGGTLQDPAPAQLQASASGQHSKTSRREIERQLAVDCDLLKIVQSLETQAEHLKHIQNQAKHARMLDQKTRQKDLERMRKLEKVVLELETQVKDIQARQSAHRDERNLADAARSKQFAEQLDQIRSEGRDERHLIMSQINQMQAQWEKREAEQQQEADALKSEITKLQKEASARDGVMELIRHDLMEMRRKITQAAAENEATAQISMQPDDATVTNTQQASSAIEDIDDENQTEMVMSVAPVRAQTQIEAVQTKETEAEIEDPEKEKVFTAKKLQPREPSPREGDTSRQSSVMTTKLSPEPDKEVARETEAQIDQDTVPVQLVYQPASPCEAKPSSQAMNKDQTVKISKVAQSSTTNQKGDQRSTPPQNEMAVQRPNVAKKTRGGSQLKLPVVTTDLGRKRKRRRTVLAKQTNDETKQPEQGKMIAEKELQPRDPSPKRVTARQSSIIKTKQSPAPVPPQRSSPATKSMGDEDTLLVQVLDPAAKPLDARPSYQVKSVVQAVKVHRIVESTPRRESTPRSPPRNQTDLGDTTQEGPKVAEATPKGAQPKKAKSVGPGRDRKRKRAVLAEVTEAPAQGPEKSEVLTETEVQPRGTSSKRVSARKPSTIQVRQLAPEPEKALRARKAPKDQNIAPAQVPQQPPTPVDAKPSERGKKKNQPTKIQKSPPVSVVDPEQVSPDALPVPTYRTRGSRNRMKENATI